MGCQKDIAEKIIKSDDLLALKGNQDHFHEEIDTSVKRKRHMAALNDDVRPNPH